MKELSYIKGDLVTLANAGEFDVIAHGCNCFCEQGKGIAKLFDVHFNTGDPAVYRLEGDRFKGDINKLGQIEFRKRGLDSNVTVVNAYTQFRYGNKEVHADYDAIHLCMKKINHRFRGQRVGLPRIGCGLAGGDWQVVEHIIKKELRDCIVTIVEYEKEVRYERV